MDTFGSRLVKFRQEHLKMRRQSQLVDALVKYGITQGNISQWENDRSLPELKKITILQKVYPELNIDWLLNGNGEMLNSKKSLTPLPPTENIAKEGSLERLVLKLQIENDLLRELLKNK